MKVFGYCQEIKLAVQSVSNAYHLAESIISRLLDTMARNLRRPGQERSVNPRSLASALLCFGLKDWFWILQNSITLKGWTISIFEGVG